MSQTAFRHPGDDARARGPPGDGRAQNAECGGTARQLLGTRVCLSSDALGCCRALRKASPRSGQQTGRLKRPVCWLDRGLAFLKARQHPSTSEDKKTLVPQSCRAATPRSAFRTRPSPGGPRALASSPGCLKAVWRKAFGPLLLGFRPKIDPGTPLDRRGFPGTSIYTKKSAPETNSRAPCPGLVAVRRSESGLCQTAFRYPGLPDQVELLVDPFEGLRVRGRRFQRVRCQRGRCQRGRCPGGLR